MFKRHIIAAILFSTLLFGEGPNLPPEAVPLLPNTPMEPSRPKPEEGSIVAVDGVWKLTSPGKLAKSYNLSVGRHFASSIAKGQVCLVVLKARALLSDRPDGKGLVTVAVQNRQNYSATVLWRQWTVGREWDTAFFSFIAENEIPEGAGLAKINAGEAKQVIEVAEMQIYRFPVGFDLFKAPQMKKSYDGREPDAPWRAAAAERIAKLRRGQLTVKVADKAGQGVAGAKLTVRMQRHLFGFGSAVDIGLLSGLSTTLPPADQLRYRSLVDEMFSRIVPENGLRVGNIDADADPKKPWEDNTRRRTGTAVQWMLQWAQDRKMTTRGHYLCWGYLEPWAAAEVLKGGTQGLLARYDRHFRHVLPFCAAYVDEWDALNHPVPFNEADALYNVVGPDVYPELYAKIRPQTDKLLFVNEDAFSPERTDAFEQHVKHMIAKGQTPDGCGFQSHFSDHSIPSMDEQWAVYQRFGAMTKHLTVTEYDLQTVDDELHADHMRDMLTLCYSHPQMTGFVIWGFWERHHWKPMAAMFKSDWTERPAVKVWRELVKTSWWTNADLVTDAEGRVSVPAYFGWFELHAEKDGKAKSLVIRHASSEGRPIVTLD
jgi:endo-1,4-beta-xylanase